jgi:hypothetical protein
MFDNSKRKVPSRGGRTSWSRPLRTRAGVRFRRYPWKERIARDEARDRTLGHRRTVDGVVCERDNRRQALAPIKTGKGSGGMHGMSDRDLPEHLKQLVAGDPETLGWSRSGGRSLSGHCVR